MPAARSRPTRAERTRAALLDAAEHLFAGRGYAATRLEDVAEAVGIRRASIFYHFRDKRELYDAVLADVLGGLLQRTRAALDGGGPFADRIEAAVGAWVDYVGARPSLARLVLREVADTTPGQGTALLPHVAPFAALVAEFSDARHEDGSGPALDLDPAHVASTIAGATIFFVAALPGLVPDGRFDPLRPAQLAAHREQVLRIIRRLLGLRGPRPAGRGARGRARS